MRDHVYVPTEGNGPVAIAAVSLGSVLFAVGVVSVLVSEPSFWEGMGRVLLPAALVAVADRPLRVILLQILGVTPHHLGLHD